MLGVPIDREGVDEAGALDLPLPAIAKPAPAPAAIAAMISHFLLLCALPLGGTELTTDTAGTCFGAGGAGAGLDDGGSL